MSTETPLEDIRQRMEERKRLNLTEGRELLQRLEAAVAEVDTLRNHINQGDSSAGAPSPAPAPESSQLPDNNIPEHLSTLLEQASTSDESRDPTTLIGSVYAWCTNWLRLRAQLMALAASEKQLQADMQQLEQEAETIRQRLAELTANRQG